MNKSIFLLAAAALLCSGCDKFSDKEISQKKTKAAEEAAVKAGAKYAARLAAAPVTESAVPSVTGEAGQAGEAMIGLLCASPSLMEDLEGDMDLIKALSGEGSDPADVKHQFLELQKRYRGIMQKALPARGASYQEFTRFATAMLSGPANLEEKLKFKALITQKCPRGNKPLVEKTAGALMQFCVASGPQ